VEDGISRGLQHCHETCCEKGGRRGRRACIVRKWFHCRDVVSRQVDLHMTELDTSLMLVFANYQRTIIFQISSNQDLASQIAKPDSPYMRLYENNHNISLSL